MTPRSANACFLWLSMLLTCTSVALGQPKKIALLIGVGTYKHPDFEPLQAVSAADLMASVLREKGFETANIRVLTNEQATRKQIDAVFREMAKTLQEGDLFFLHLYTHGVLIRDHNGDEADGVDEAFAAFDSRYSDAEHHEQLLIDDHLGEYINRLRRIVGPQGHICALIDACHSGTGLRSGPGNAQGEGVPGGVRKIWDRSDGQTDELAPVVAFYSAYPRQKSREVSIGGNQRLGLMTWSFCRSLNSARASTSYRALFEQVSLHIMKKAPHKQTPMLEGDADLQVFGLPLPQPPAYFRVYAPIGQYGAILQAGMLHGVHAGATFALFPPDTRDTGLIKALAYGTAASQGLLLTECRLILDRPLDEAAIASAWVMPASFRLPVSNTTLRVETADTLVRAKLQRQLGGVGATLSVNTDDAPDITLRPVGHHAWELRTDGDDLLWKGGYKNQLPSELVDALRGYTQAQLLRSLALEGEGYPMSFSASTAAAPDNWMAVGLAVQQRKEVVTLRVVNQAKRAVYYNILDIDARHRVTVLVPGPSWHPVDCRLDPGEQRIHRVVFHEPGREVLKLIATPAPIDLRPAMATRGKNKGNTDIAARLLHHFKDPVDPNRGDAGAYNSQEAGISTVVLEIVPESVRNR